MGNTIKNFEKKQRKDKREAYKELQGIVRDTIIQKYPMPAHIKEKEKEVLDILQ